MGMDHAGRCAYHTTRSASIKTNEDKYRKYAAAWHKLPVHGNKPARYPGKWRVKIYMDEEVLASEKFVISDVDVDKLTGTPQPKDAEKYGLVIGIENYQSLPNANYALRDARLFRDYLIHILGVPEKNITVLENMDATRARIRSQLTTHLPGYLPKSATLYVYYSGHGHALYKSSDKPEDNAEKAYLIAYDGDPTDMANTGYSIKTFYQDLRNLDIKQSLVFIDSCFSGSLNHKITSEMIDPSRSGLIELNLEKNEKLNAMRKVISLNSSTGVQRSLPYAAKQHGLFSYFLFKGLCGVADTDGNREVSLYELYNYINENVDKASTRINQKQTPVIIPGLNKLEDISICKVAK